MEGQKKHTVGEAWKRRARMRMGEGGQDQVHFMEPRGCSSSTLIDAYLGDCKCNNSANNLSSGVQLN